MINETFLRHPDGNTFAVSQFRAGGARSQGERQSRSPEKVSSFLLCQKKQNPVFMRIVLLDKVMMLLTGMGMGKACDNVDNIMQIHQSVISVIRISSLILITIRSTA